MARSLEYRPLGVGIASLPGVNFVATGTAQARVANTISQSLDQMSRFAFQQYETQAKIEGAEFGAANAPSIADLIKAEDAEARKALIPGSIETVRGRAERQAALNTVAANLEIAARDAIKQIAVEGHVNFTNVVDLQKQIDGVINGFSGAMTDVDPATGAKLRLGLSTIGNTAYTTHVKMMAEKAEKQAEYIAKRGADQIIDEIPGMVFTQAARGLEEMAGHILKQREKLVNFADAIEDPTFLVNSIANFDKAVSEAKINAIGEYVSRDPLKNSQEILDTLNTGKMKITDNSIANIAVSLNSEERLEAFKRSNTAINDLYARETQQDARIERQRKNAARNLEGELTGFLIDGGADDDVVRAKIVALRDLDPDKAAKFYDAYFVKGGNDDPDTILMLDQKGMDKFLTVEDVLDARANRKITLDSARKYLTVIKSNRDTFRTQAINKIKNALGVPDIGMLTLDASGERSEAAKFVMQGMVELDAAIQQDPNLDRIKWADGFIERGNVQKRLRDGISSALSTINKIKNQQLGMSGAKTDTEDALDAIILKSSSVLEGSARHQENHNKLLDAIATVKRNRAALEQ
ncbi:MAG: hypothetical protein ACO23H_05250 [Alphaproteobacteria bacterium]